MANEVALLAQLLFSEAYKKDLNIASKDATAIAHVVKNRMANRGQTLDEVVFAPYQFSGVNSNEWNKVKSGKLTKQEELMYKKFLQISNGVLSGNIKDTTGGADHYFNPKLVKPSWSKKMKKTYSTEGHDYYKQ